MKRKFVGSSSTAMIRRPGCDLAGSPNRSARQEQRSKTGLHFLKPCLARRIATTPTFAPTSRTVSPGRKRIVLIPYVSFSSSSICSSIPNLCCGPCAIYWFTRSYQPKSLPIPTNCAKETPKTQTTSKLLGAQQPRVFEISQHNDIATDSLFHTSRAGIHPGFPRSLLRGKSRVITF